MYDPLFKFQELSIIHSFKGPFCFFGSLRKRLTFHDATNGFPMEWRLRNKCRNSILMTHHYLDLDRTSDWFEQISHAA